MFPQASRRTPWVIASDAAEQPGWVGACGPRRSPHAWLLEFTTVDRYGGYMSFREDGPEHECRQRRKCKARLRDTEGEWHGAGVEAPGSLCRPCEQHAFAALGQLGTDYALLAGARTVKRSRISGPKVSGSSERSIPITLAVDTLMTRIDDETLRWALRITRGDPLPPHPADRVRRCVAILCANTGTLIDLPPTRVAAWLPHPEGGDVDGLDVLDGVKAVLRLASYHHRAIKILGLDEPRDEMLRESCHVCGRAALVMSMESQLITCRGCHNVWHQDQLARLNNPLAAA